MAVVSVRLARIVIGFLVGVAIATSSPADGAGSMAEADQVDDTGDRAKRADELIFFGNQQNHPRVLAKKSGIDLSVTPDHGFVSRQDPNAEVDIGGTVVAHAQIPLTEGVKSREETIRLEEEGKDEEFQNDAVNQMLTSAGLEKMAAEYEATPIDDADATPIDDADATPIDDTTPILEPNAGAPSEGGLSKFEEEVTGASDIEPEKENTESEAENAESESENAESEAENAEFEAEDTEPATSDVKTQPETESASVVENKESEPALGAAPDIGALDVAEDTGRTGSDSSDETVPISDDVISDEDNDDMSVDDENVYKAEENMAEVEGAEQQQQDNEDLETVHQFTPEEFTQLERMSVNSRPYGPYDEQYGPQPRRQNEYEGWLHQGHADAGQQLPWLPRKPYQTRSHGHPGYWERMRRAVHGGAGVKPLDRKRRIKRDLYMNDFDEPYTQYTEPEEEDMRGYYANSDNNTDDDRDDDSEDNSEVSLDDVSDQEVELIYNIFLTYLEDKAAQQMAEVKAAQEFKVAQQLEEEQRLYNILSGRQPQQTPRGLPSMKNFRQGQTPDLLRMTGYRDMPAAADTSSYFVKPKRGGDRYYSREMNKRYLSPFQAESQWGDFIPEKRADWSYFMPEKRAEVAYDEGLQRLQRLALALSEDGGTYYRDMLEDYKK